jgi:hypothetical protein
LFESHPNGVIAATRAPAGANIGVETVWFKSHIFIFPQFRERIELFPLDRMDDHRIWFVCDKRRCQFPDELDGLIGLSYFPLQLLGFLIFESHRLFVELGMAITKKDYMPPPKYLELEE